MITFAVVGHDEEATLTTALDQATAACEPGDEICFVDSASTDRSAQIATKRGIRTISAPLGKGNAIAALVRVCRTEYVCCLDADIQDSERNIAVELARAVRGTGDDLILGDFVEAPGAVPSNTVAVYTPLVGALFPELAGRFGTKPLTGFRAFRVPERASDFPPDFGVEAHLNITFGASDKRIRVIQVGKYQGPFRYKPAMGREIAKAILDLGERLGRLDRATRSDWVEWMEPIVTHIATYHGASAGREAFVDRLFELCHRQMPNEASTR